MRESEWAVEEVHERRGEGRAGWGGGTCAA